MTTKEIIEVVQALEDRKSIEWRHIDEPKGAWIDYLPMDRPGFNFYSYDYRIKPEPPKPREWWIHPNGEGAPQPETIFSKVLTEKPENPLWVHVREVLPEENL